MTYYNKFKDYTTSPIVLPRSRGLAGRFRLETFKGTEFPKGSGNVYETPGTRRVRAEFDNIITNLGLNKLGGTSMNNSYYFHVGTDNTPETEFNTSLLGFVASKVNSTYDLGQPGTYWAQTTPPYYGSHQKMARFNAGFGGGAVNIAEVGISTTSGTGNCFSRALTVDGVGDPAAVPVDADEYLDVYYTLRNYPDHVLDSGGIDDGTGTIDISGTSYDYTIRVANATSGSYWARNVNLEVRGQTGLPSAVTASYYAYGSDATLGAVTSSPASASTDNVLTTTCYEGSYVNDTFERTIYYPFSLSKGNVSGGIKALWLPYTKGIYQLLFNNPIPKDGTKTMTFVMTFGWGRKVLP